MDRLKKPSSQTMIASGILLSCYLLLLLLRLLLNTTHAAEFEIRNQCPYTVWAAAVPTGGGRQLNSGQSWTINITKGTTTISTGRIWARTGCIFDTSGRGQCQTGDCGGLIECTSYGQPPNTMAEFSLGGVNNMDFLDISLVDGFNVPMDFSPTSSNCVLGTRCIADIKGECPNELRVPGGCNSPCNVFKSEQYCCNIDFGSCGPTMYSKFFKDRCTDTYTYPKDDGNAIFVCSYGTNYRVVFCPAGQL